MKLIIDIDKDYYEIIKHEVEHGHDFKPYTLIAHGTPFDDIKAEINKKLKEPEYIHDGEDWQSGLIMAEIIIDKYCNERGE